MIYYFCICCMFIPSNEFELVTVLPITTCTPLAYTFSKQSHVAKNNTVFYLLKRPQVAHVAVRKQIMNVVIATVSHR